MYRENAYSDAITQEASLPGWEQEYRQVSPGRFKGNVSALLYPGLSILRERINVSTEQLFSAPEGSLVFYYYSSANPGQLVRGGDNSSPAGFAFDWKDRVGMMGVNSDLLMVVIDQQTFSEEIKQRSGGCRGSSARQAEFVADWLLSVLNVLADRACADGMSGQLNAVLPDLVRDRLTLLLHRSELVQVPAVVNAEAAYRRLRDWIYTTPQDDPPTVSAISRALGFQPAVLRRACTQFTGTQLDHLLVLLRLNGARRDLIAARERKRRVCDIAMDWGFMHWSRFAARYRELFGETPSQTLRSH